MPGLAALWPGGDTAGLGGAARAAPVRGEAAPRLRVVATVAAGRDGASPELGVGVPGLRGAMPPPSIYGRVRRSHNLARFARVRMKSANRSGTAGSDLAACTGGSGHNIFDGGAVAAGSGLGECALGVEDGGGAGGGFGWG